MNIIKEKALRNKAVIDAVYEAGKQAGGGGGDSHYDTFWNVYQDNGNRTIYSNAFSGYGWTDETFKPKYDIKPTAAVSMFQTTQITNLKKILDDCGVRLDFSNCSSFNYVFQQSKITHIGIIDVSKASSINYFMPEAKFIYIEKLKLKDDGSQTFTSLYSFSNCKDLEHIIFEGVIGKANFDLHWSTKLDADSLKSIIDCLSPATTGLTVTLPATAQANYDAFYGEGAWATITGTKSNWTIAYL